MSAICPACHRWNPNEAEDPVSEVEAEQLVAAAIAGSGAAPAQDLEAFLRWVRARRIDQILIDGTVTGLYVIRNLHGAARQPHWAPIWVARELGADVSSN